MRLNVSPHAQGQCGGHRWFCLQGTISPLCSPCFWNGSCHPLQIPPSWAVLIGSVMDSWFILGQLEPWLESFELGPKVSFWSFQQPRSPSAGRRETGKHCRGREGQLSGFSMTLSCWAVSSSGLSSLPPLLPACLGPTFTQGSHKCPGVQKPGRKGLCPLDDVGGC